MLIERAILSVFFLVGAMAAPLGAQTYPSKPMRLVLPFPPGGATDILGRIVGQAMIGLMSGEVDMVVIGTPAALPQIQAERVRALAVLHETRLPSLPNVPTSKEAGIDYFVVTSWYGILAPVGTPRDIVNRLNAEWLKIAALPDTKEKMEKAGVDPLSSTPEQFSEFIKTETARWGKVIRDANVTID